MSDSVPRCMSRDLIGKLRNLAERRQAHFLDLQETGRWRYYYSEREFAASKREVIQLAEAWALMDGRAAE